MPLAHTATTQHYRWQSAGWIPFPCIAEIPGKSFVELRGFSGGDTEQLTLFTETTGLKFGDAPLFIRQVNTNRKAYELATFVMEKRAEDGDATIREVAVCAFTDVFDLARHLRPQAKEPEDKVPAKRPKPKRNNSNLKKNKAGSGISNHTTSFSIPKSKALKRPTYDSSAFELAWLLALKKYKGE